MDDTFDVAVRAAVYRHFADTGQPPTLDAMREVIGATSEQVMDAYRRLYARRMLVPTGDFTSIRMASPFSGVPTQHRAIVSGKGYFANCAWDAFGVVSALGTPGDVFSPLRNTGTAGAALAGARPRRNVRVKVDDGKPRAGDMSLGHVQHALWLELRQHQRRRASAASLHVTVRSSAVSGVVPRSAVPMRPAPAAESHPRRLTVES